jgi:hypothetical protein
MRKRVRREGRQYAAIPNEAMRSKQISLEARGMLALMMGYSDDWVFYRAHLMEIAGIGRDKFQRIMGELMEAGYVSREYVKDEKGRLLGQTYVIHDEPVSESLKSRSSAEGLDSRRTGEPTDGFSGPIRKPDSKENQTKEENQCPPTPKGEDDLFSEFEEKQRNEDPPPKDERPTVEELFNEWWNLYPRRPNDPKKPALAKFKAALRKVSFDDLMAATRAFAETRRGEDPKFTPMAKAWLHQERWDGFLAAAEPQAPLRDPDDPFVGLPPAVLEIVNLEIGEEARRRAAAAYWARREAAE